MVVYEYYPKDQRVRREAEILVQDGARVDVISLKGHKEKVIDRTNLVNIFRIPIRKKKSEGGGFFMYFFGYLSFLILSTTILLWLFLIKRYKIIHVHSMPDYLVFCALVPKLLGARIILDLHELTPEVYATKFKTSLESRSTRISKGIERSSSRFADTVITTNNLRCSIIKKRTKKESVETYMNLPILSIFKKRDMSKFIHKHDLGNSFIVLYIGELDPEREIDVALKAIKNVEDRIPNVKLLICGTGQEDYIDFVNRTIKDLKLDERVLNVGLVPLEDILNYVSMANDPIRPKAYEPRARGYGHIL
jgi:glycosyltransferase involved in cell wall biosynthesis